VANIEQLMKSFVKTLLNPSNKINKEKRLFCAIIIQAIEDASYKGLDKRHLKYKHEAIEWLTTMSEDFCYITEIAGYNPEYIKDKIKNLMLIGYYQFTQEQYDVLFYTGNNKRIVVKLNNDKS